MKGFFTLTLSSANTHFILVHMIDERKPLSQMPGCQLPLSALFSTTTPSSPHYHPLYSSIWVFLPYKHHYFTST